MQKDNKFFDDLAKMTTSAASSMMDMKREMDGMVAAQVEKWLKNSRLATKEEIDTALGMLAKLRSEQEEMKKRLDQLQSEIKSLKNNEAK